MAYDVVRECDAMIAGMTPRLKGEKYFFCSTSDPVTELSLIEGCLACFREDEGTTLVLTQAEAIRCKFDVSNPLARIVLEVFSALDGVGLTAAVATALSNQGIPCNIIAAYHHDNVFVPAPLGERALCILQDVQARAATRISEPERSISEVPRS